MGASSHPQSSMTGWHRVWWLRSLQIFFFFIYLHKHLTNGLNVTRIQCQFKSSLQNTLPIIAMCDSPAPFTETVCDDGWGILYFLAASVPQVSSRPGGYISTDVRGGSENSTRKGERAECHFKWSKSSTVSSVKIQFPVLLHECGSFSSPPNCSDKTDSTSRKVQLLALAMEWALQIALLKSYRSHHPWSSWM